ncbi:MAG TPA: hypothetical protein D7I11_06855 [Candidatus Poseidoniales archaeon]|nr:hypothetical protein [Euryarchaeota archaeon]DAC53320.1 MAG TPA: hypothetical protein D7I11_06855 [Candidatus Poseidoniales archaeon]
MNEGSGVIRFRKGYDPQPCGPCMSGNVRDGERIPRREPPAFEEADNIYDAWRRDGFFGTALEDKNQFGPITMMVLLLIVATITGVVINILG